MRHLSTLQTLAGALILMFVSIASAETIPTAETNYKTYCVQCHGIKGDGYGVNTSAMSLLPRKHTDTKSMSELSDERIFKAIKGGGLAVSASPVMPAWGATLSDKEITGLVGYLRKLCQCEHGK